MRQENAAWLLLDPLLCTQKAGYKEGNTLSLGACSRTGQAVGPGPPCINLVACQTSNRHRAGMQQAPGGLTVFGQALQGDLTTQNPMNWPSTSFPRGQQPLAGLDFSGLPPLQATGQRPLADLLAGALRTQQAASSSIQQQQQASPWLAWTS